MWVLLVHPILGIMEGSLNIEDRLDWTDFSVMIHGDGSSQRLLSHISTILASTTALFFFELPQGSHPVLADVLFDFSQHGWIIRIFSGQWRIIGVLRHLDLSL